VSSNRLHIVNILEEGAIGGPQRRSLAVARELSERPAGAGADTTLLFPRGADALKHACAAMGVSTAQLPIDTLSRQPKAALRYVATSIPQILSMARWLRKTKPDVVHVSGGSFCFKGPIAARLAGVPFLWHLNDTKSDRKVRRTFQVVATLFRPAHLIFAAHAVQRSYAEWLPRGVEGSIVPAPHRSDLLDLSRADFADPYPEACGQRILMLSNINTVKGLDDALDAIQQVNAHATLFIAGGVKSTQEAYFKQLQDRVAKDGLPVVFLGHCSDVGPYLLHADMSLCASLAEASPLSVWEAAATGKAIVSTDVGDVARELPDEEAALIVAVGDSQAMANALDRIASDESLRTRLGNAARQRMQLATSVEQVGNLSLNAYEKAAIS